MMENPLFKEGLDVMVDSGVNLGEDSVVMETRAEKGSIVETEDQILSGSMVHLNSMPTHTLREKSSLRQVSSLTKSNSLINQGRKSFGPRHFPFKERNLNQIN